MFNITLQLKLKFKLSPEIIVCQFNLHSDINEVLIFPCSAKSKIVTATMDITRWVSELQGAVENNWP